MGRTGPHSGGPPFQTSAIPGVRVRVTVNPSGPPEWRTSGMADLWNGGPESHGIRAPHEHTPGKMTLRNCDIYSVQETKPKLDLTW